MSFSRAGRIARVFPLPVGLVALAVAACSGSGSPPGDASSSSGSQGSSSGGSSGGSTSGGAGSSSGGTSSSGGAPGDAGSSSGGDPTATCVAACEAQHPNGARLGRGIDTCWAQSCATECTGIGTGQTKPPVTGTCKNPVSTPSSTCSQCTVDRCCTAWDACFDDADCSALNACSIACFR